MADDHRSISKSRGPAPTCLVRRLAVLIVLVGAVAVPLQLISSSPASASPPDSCKNPHCYDQAVIGVALSGLEGQWTDEDFQIPASEVDAPYTSDGYGLYHFSEEMWLLTDESTDQWVEEGLARACDTDIYSQGEQYVGQSCTNAGGVPAYEQFWADDNKEDEFYWHLIGTLTPDGDNHVYEIWDSSNGGNIDYEVYLDYNLVATTTDQIKSSGYGLQSGFELYSPGINNKEYSGNFNQYMQQYVNSVGSWQNIDIDGSQDEYVNDPCDSANPASNGQCFNHAVYHPYEWSDSKPAS